MGRAFVVLVKLVVASAMDEASVTIREQLLRLARWRVSDRGGFEGREVFEHAQAGLTLVTIPDLHLDHDRIDEEARSALGYGPQDIEAVVFLSKHRAESGTRSLTVHPIGNFSSADLGGRPGTLVPAASEAMTEALRCLARRAHGLGFRVTFEATHHGPFLVTPAFFYELGSGPADWANTTAAQALAEALLDVRPRAVPVGIGVGGGHYVPRMTDVALARRIAFGHLVPSRAVESLDDAMLDRVLEATPGATFAYLHRKSLEPADVRRLEAALSARGIRVVREADLPMGPPAQSSSSAP